MSIFAAVVTAPGQTVGVSVYIDYFIESWEIYGQEGPFVKENRSIKLDEQIDSVIDVFTSLFPPCFCS